MRQYGIVHPEMLARIQPNFYPSLCTIQTAGTTQDDHGHEGGAPTNLPGHVDIPCRIAPAVASSGERRSSQQIYVENVYNVALNGYYPEIQETMLAVVDAVTYGIEHVGHDGNHKTTSLSVRLVE